MTIFHSIFDKRSFDARNIKTTLAMVHYRSAHRAHGSALAYFCKPSFWNIHFFSAYLCCLYSYEESIFQVRLEKRIVDVVFSRRNNNWRLDWRRCA